MNIIKNFLEDNYLKELQKKIDNDANFPWYLVNRVAHPTNDDGFYFVHEFYRNNCINSNFFEMIVPFLEKIKPKSLIRAKANLYPSSEKLIEHGTHVDFTYKHNTLLFYLNTNNGFTRFDDKKISSVENKAVVFDGSTPHNSTNCTDQNYRITINFNYF